MLAETVAPLQSEIVALKSANETAQKTANHAAAETRKAAETTPASAAKTPAEARKAARQEAALIAARQAYQASGGKTGKDADTFFKYFNNDYAITSENGNVFATPLDDDGNEISDGRKPFSEVLTESKATPIYSGFFQQPKPNTGAARSSQQGGYPPESQVIRPDGSTDWTAAAKAVKTF